MPGRVVERRVGRAKAAASRLRDQVMGSDEPTPSSYPGGYQHGRELDRNPYAVPAGAHHEGTRWVASGVADQASEAASSVSDAASSAVETVQETPQAVRRQTQGNPLAAGLIAFGVGWLVSSLLPASRQEQQLAEQARTTATEVGRPLADKARHAAAEIRDNLQEPARHAVESVRSTATVAGHAVADEGRAGAQDLNATTRDAAGTVRRGAGNPA
jgi:hypothetical protein